jgi:tetratricopeptide (TPR) repeat protein
MTTPASPLDVARKLIFELQPLEALATLSDVPASATALALRARALLEVERFDECDRMLSVAFSRDPSERDLAELRLVRATMLRRSSPLLDEGLDSALRSAQGAERIGAKGLAVEARIEAARIFCRKRVRVLAEEQLARARSVNDADLRIAIAEGDMLNDFDDRMAAIDRYRIACMAGAPVDRGARVGLANVAYLLGQFDEAYGHLQALGTLRSGEVRARRLRVRLLQAQQRWSDVAQAMDDLLRALPGSDLAEMDRYDRACAMYRAGWFQHALGAFQELAATPGASRWVDLARRTTRMLTRPDVGQRRWSRLQAFPTVAQLRSHCGPASCELYLRYFGIPASQIEVARAIKLSDRGTPLYRMRSFLEQAGFHTRRIEAELPLLKRLIDIQIPIIMEEDYVTTGHVSVAIGYDDIRDVLDVQDPMSHEVRETNYEDLNQLRGLSNHGALVAVPRNDAARIALLDRVGAVECRYMTLVDMAIAAKDDGKPEEGDRLVEESIALRRDYEFAWFYKFNRAMQKLDREDTPDARVAVHQIVSQVCSIWPDDAWPHRFRGEALAMDGRWRDAIAAYERAKEKDPSDPRVWSSLGMCHRSLGDNDLAYECFQNALRRDPSSPTANGQLALLSLERGEIDRAMMLSDVALRREPDSDFHHYVRARIHAKRGEHEKAIASYDRAIGDAPKPATRFERAQSLAKLGKLDEVRAYLEDSCKRNPTQKWIRVDLAKLLYEHGRAAEAEAVARQAFREGAEIDPIAHAVLGAAILAGDGNEEEGLKSLHKALSMQPTNAWAQAELGKHLRRKKDWPHAIRASAAAMGLAPSEARHQYEFGKTLALAGYPGQAADHLTKGGLGADIGEEDIIFVGRVLADAKRAARPFLDDLLAKRPEDVAVLRGYARTMLELFWGPHIAKTALDRLCRIAPNDPYAKAHRGAQAMDTSLPKETEGEDLLRQAIAQAPEREYPRRALAERLQTRGRWQEVIDVLQPCGISYQVSRMRIRALLALERYAEVNAEIAAFDKKWGDGKQPSYGAIVFRFDVEQRKGNWRAALDLSEQLSREDGERDDDGKLDTWEVAKIECLIRLGELDRALRFGERQAMDAPSLGRLALISLDAGVPELAQAFGERAMRFDNENVVAIYMTGKVAELRGDEAGARTAYEAAAKRDDQWFRPLVSLAFLDIAKGDLQAARARAERAVQLGHTVVHALVARGQFLFASGQSAAAVQDLDRAWNMLRPELRPTDWLDAWAVRAHAMGNPVQARELAAQFLRGKVSPFDRARIQRLVP